MNISLSTKESSRDPIQIGATNLTPATNTKFLGIIIDSRLSFSMHVDQIYNKYNSRICLFVRLKRFGLNNQGLRTYYISHIRSILTYGSAAWFGIITNQNKDRLERIQRTATRILLPDLPYTDRLKSLNLPRIDDYIRESNMGYLAKIMERKQHPLHKHLKFNTTRTSVRCPKTF